MSDRVYYRANFSNVTTPSSSGGRQLDDDGNELATIPIQLPANLISSANPPKGVEMMLTKLDIPLGRLPAAIIPIDNVSVDSMGDAIIQTKGRITIVPYCFDKYGKLVPGDDELQDIWYPSGGIGEFNWYIEHVEVPMTTLRSSPKYSQSVIRLQTEKEYHFHSIDNFLSILSKSLHSAMRQVLQTARLPETEGEYFFPVFTPTRDSLSLEISNRGCPYSIAPYTDQLFEDGHPRPANRALVQELNQDGSTVDIDFPQYFGFSVAVNKYIRDMLPSLPWREVNNDYLTKIHPAGGIYVGQGLPNWKWENYDDPVMYILDTNSANVEFLEDATSLSNAGGELRYVKSTRVRYNFTGFNLLAIVPISSFVVMLDGISLASQTMPINLNSANEGAAQTTSIPVIENYYPLWQDITDLSCNLIVSKDAFTNAAPIVLDRGAMYERNFRFSVYYITKNGKMHILKIPPGTCLSLQLCYSFIY